MAIYIYIGANHPKVVSNMDKIIEIKDAPTKAFPFEVPTLKFIKRITNNPKRIAGKKLPSETSWTQSK